MENGIVLYEDGALELEVRVSDNGENLWLSANEMGQLFSTSPSTIRKHISNIFSIAEIDKENNAQKMRVDGVKQPVSYYSLDVILSVGYRVNSRKGIKFRRWASSILKKYIIDGYAVNEKRIQAYEKTIDIQAKMLAGQLDIETFEVLNAVNNYTEALILLDQYDHQALVKPDGINPIFRITYSECRQIIDNMEYSFSSDVFGRELEKGKVEGILAAIYQSFSGEDVYPSLEEKAANLLYFMIKDHPFADGCKRIAATLFVEFLAKNNALIKDGKEIISKDGLVAITLMIAESNPSEKEIMVTLVMNLLKL